MRSIKHTHRFAYTRHNKVFDNIEHEVNWRELGRTIKTLRASAEHTEIRSPKRFGKAFVNKKPDGLINSRELVSCYSLTWYTRKDLGLKNASAA